jgi:lysophospholipase L1-like esterase
LSAGSVVAAFALLELGARIFLGPPPAYPIGDGPHLLLANVLRFTGPDSPTYQHGAIPYWLEQQVMRGEIDGPMENRPPPAMVTKEIVCSIVYGDAYTSVIDVRRELAQVFPQPVPSRPGTSRRVLHVGDSMVFGANVARDQTFTVRLEELEPDVQHLNGGISGTAPDDYLVVLRRWVERQPIDLAVMYLFAGNDLIGTDAPHPCSAWQPILTYDDGNARLRYASAPQTAHGLGVQWMVHNSPLPYLLRAMITGRSVAAAFVGAAFDSWVTQVSWRSGDEPVEHLEAILRSARDELRERHIGFVVVVLPAAAAIGIPDGPSDYLSRHVRDIAARLDIPALDATDVLRDSLARGEHPVQSDGSHFNEEGHRLIAKWLHAQLAPLVRTSIEDGGAVAGGRPCRWSM